MMYYLYWLSQPPHYVLSGFNVFQYVSFRAICASITAFLLCLLFGSRVIRLLTALKFGQPIRTAEEVHRLHELHGGKKGTPTMGGVLLMGAVIVATVLWARWDNGFVWLCLFTILFTAALGFADDYLKVKKRRSDGLPGRVKLLCQFLLAAVVTAYFLLNPGLQVQAKELFIPFFKDPIIENLGWFTLAFYALVIVGASNAVNLTDGLDGLATGCTVTVASTYAVMTYAAGNIPIATYLDLPFYRQSGELTVLCAALVGAGLGFLWFNCHPAKVFMGDTGSLSIGSTLGVVAICCKQELLLTVVGGIFVIEALSVIAQVASFRLRGKRVLLMAPLHHHFELKGWQENTVIVRFWAMSLMFAFLGLATLKLR
ncbi:MAG: phospho-N-acetylmuramoyl-pentapeptide-transferase [Verrucomicrobia bacterium]|nr:phospho-N-acetylmuramoyl-pentapeptide-transferase [Verrucomicrobiota bacterium]